MKKQQAQTEEKSKGTPITYQHVGIAIYYFLVFTVLVLASMEIRHLLNSHREHEAETTYATPTYPVGCTYHINAGRTLSPADWQLIADVSAACSKVDAALQTSTHYED